MDDNVRNRRAGFKVLKTTDEVGGGLFCRKGVKSVDY